MTVGRHMRRHPPVVAPGDPLDVAEHRLRDLRLDAMLVVEQSRLRGILAAERVSPGSTSTPTLERPTRPRRTVSVEAVMLRDPVTVAPETPLAEAARLMRDRGLGILPVILDDKVVGALLVWDLIALLATDTPRA